MGSSFVKCLGEPVEENQYFLRTNLNGKWWLTHCVVGSGEPLQQAIDTSLEGQIIEKIMRVREMQKQYFGLRKTETKYPSGNSRKVLKESKRLEAELDAMLEQYEREVSDDKM